MHITTLERLDRLANGTKVAIAGHDWTKVDEGLERNGETLPLLSFRSLAEGRQITDNTDAPTDLPAWRRGGDTWYYVLKEDPVSEGYLTVIFDGRGNFYGMETYPLNNINSFTVPRTTPTLNEGAWTAAAYALADRLLPDTFLGSGVAASSGLIEALHDHAKDHPELDLILVEHNVGRVRKGEVTVTARGTAEVKAEQFGNVEVDGNPTVNWKFRYDYPAITNVTDPCLCLSFNDALYRARLPQNVLTDEHAMECTEDDCVNKAR